MLDRIDQEGLGKYLDVRHLIKPAGIAKSTVLTHAGMGINLRSPKVYIDPNQIEKETGILLNPNSSFREKREWLSLMKLPDNILSYLYERTGKITNGRMMNKLPNELGEDELNMNSSVRLILAHRLAHEIGHLQ